MLALLLDKDNLDKGNICVEIPSFWNSLGDSLGFCGVSGSVTMSKQLSSALIMVISPENSRKLALN